MNLFDIGKETKHQNTIRVLVYPNVTFQKDLEKDSYIQVIKNQIRLLNEIRDDLWFYLILTEPTPSLQFDNVTQMYIDLPTYPPTMRSHFDVLKLQKMLDRKLDFDLVMTHLPEHAHALKNTLYNVTHHMPPFFGYCHWFDVKDVVAWPKDSFLQNITGLLEYERCYLNTQHQKDLVLNQAKETFNDKTVSKLNDILTVQHLGVNEGDIINEINETPEKIIVFNHRPDTYKHFKEFIAVMDKLWDIRKDFKVWIPLLEKPNRDYVVTTKGDKQWYYKQLQKCYVGFSPKQTYGGWSVATTDGMMNGVPYVMYDDTYYHELNPKGDFFENDDIALTLLNNYLDDPQYRNEQAEQALDCIRESLIYKNKMNEMSDYINLLLEQSHQIGESEKFQDICQWVKTAGSISKEELIDKLGWGRGIKWTPYRRALMNHPNIYDVNSSEPKYCWVE
jgi:hypothetical protein